MSPTVTCRSAETYSCRAMGPASCRTMFLSSQEKIDSEKKDQQVKLIVYISLHYWGHSFTNSFAGLAGRTTERCHPALLLFLATFPIHAFIVTCILADMQWTQLGNWHGSKLNSPPPPWISFQSHQYLDPDHFMAATTLVLVWERGKVEMETRVMTSYSGTSSFHCVYETMAWSSIAQSCTTPYTVCNKH